MVRLTLILLAATYVTNTQLVSSETIPKTRTWATYQHWTFNVQPDQLDQRKESRDQRKESRYQIKNTRSNLPSSLRINSRLDALARSIPPLVNAEEERTRLTHSEWNNGRGILHVPSLTRYELPRAKLYSELNNKARNILPDNDQAPWSNRHLVKISNRKDKDFRISKPFSLFSQGSTIDSDWNHVRNLMLGNLKSKTESKQQHVKLSDDNSLILKPCQTPSRQNSGICSKWNEARNILIKNNINSVPESHTPSIIKNEDSQVSRPEVVLHQESIYSDFNEAKNLLLGDTISATEAERSVEVSVSNEDEDSEITLSSRESKLIAEWEDAMSKLNPSVDVETQTVTEDNDDVKNLLLPNNSPDLEKSVQPALASWHDVNINPGLTLPSNPKLWKPPSYFQSLKEIEDAMANIKMHFVVDKNTPKTDIRYKYIAVVHVIEGLTREVSQHGWGSYNDNYEALVQKLLTTISQHPEETLAEVNCVFHASIKKIQRIKKLMTNQWVVYLCKAQPCVCDTLVYAIVQMSGDEELKQEAELLLLLGLAASDYLDIYSRLFEAISRQNVYSYLKNSKETLRTLIYKNSIARRHSSFSLKDQCYEQHAKELSR